MTETLGTLCRTVILRSLPEAQVDFIAGGTKVYVIALASGYEF